MPHPAPGTATAAAASGHGADDLGELRKRVAALEARLAELEARLDRRLRRRRVLKEVARSRRAPAGRLRAGASSRDRPAHGSPGRGRARLSPPSLSTARSRRRPPVWQEGNTRLLDYGPTHRAARKRGARAVLVVPSLINRWEVLDLTAEKSLLRAMAAEGLRPYLVDWGTPDAEERRFDLHGLCRSPRARGGLCRQARPPRAGGDGLLHGRHARGGAGRAPAAPGRGARAARRALGLPCRQDRPRLPALAGPDAGADWPTGWASCRSMCCRPCSGRSIPGSR